MKPDPNHKLKRGMKIIAAFHKSTLPYKCMFTKGTGEEQQSFQYGGKITTLAGRSFRTERALTTYAGKKAFTGYNVYMFKKVDGFWVDL